MSFGQNVQFLQKMRNRMTQEELAEKLNVSRQTISKWELDLACPEMNKLVELCELFSCSMDQLVREDICVNEEAYSEIRTEKPFRLIPNAYRVIMTHMQVNGIRHREDPAVIPCFEREYDLNGVHCMDVFIAAE